MEKRALSCMIERGEVVIRKEAPSIAINETAT
jgi:hypothetical protein